MVFLKGEFLRKGDINDNDRFFEVDESHKGALNPDKEDDSDLLPNRSVPSSRSIPLGTDSEATFLRRSQRENVPHRRFGTKGEAFMSALREVDEPKNNQEVVTSQTFEERKLVMQDEMKFMRKNQVCDLIYLPPEHKTIRNKWVLKVKHYVEGSIERYKI